VGSHVIRRNTIFDCGQNGIVGHLGCVFSTIEENHIYNIAVKREFYGYEIAGIKLHAAIDVVIRHNRIHDCTLGTWLDWQTQGTRLSRNLFNNNNRDLFVEVSHGPYLVEHNILGSAASLELFSQGGAFINNLVCGTMRIEPVLDRATPYHVPHSTQIAGYAVISGGDDRYIGNIFVGTDPDAAYGPGAEGDSAAVSGTVGYDGHPASFEAYLERIAEHPPGDHQRFQGVKQPVYARNNVYLCGARPFAGEQNALVLDDGAVSVLDQGDEVYLATELPSGFEHALADVVTGRSLERARMADADFEERDGSPAVIDVDFLGQPRRHGAKSSAGPLVGLAAGTNRVRIW
jgi:hypothetical protein